MLAQKDIKICLRFSFLSFKFLFFMHFLSNQGHSFFFFFFEENFLDINSPAWNYAAHTFTNKYNSDEFYFASTMACLLGGTLL